MNVTNTKTFAGKTLKGEYTVQTGEIKISHVLGNMVVPLGANAVKTIDQIVNLRDELSDLIKMIREDAGVSGL